MGDRAFGGSNHFVFPGQLLYGGGKAVNESDEFKKAMEKVESSTIIILSIFSQAYIKLL